ncbi:MAG TPA: sigma-70 family RNA polymerase sigma factor [Candidatus Deferrimicrobiaceae bacterium]
MSFDDDSELACKVQAGDRNAFETLLTRYERPIHAFIFHFFHDTALCQDLTQETFLRIWRFIGSFRPEEKFSTWLYSIAKNLCIDELRRIQKGGTVDIEAIDPEMFSTDADSGTDPVRATMAVQEGDVLRRAVARLPEKYRTCIILFYFNELSYEEISAVMNVSLSNTKILLFRGKKMLSDLYRKETSGRGVTRG